MDHFDDCDPPVGYRDNRRNTWVVVLLATLGIGPGLLWYLTGDPTWACGWLLLLILGLAG